MVGCFSRIFNKTSDSLDSKAEITVFNKDEKQAQLTNLVGNVCNILKQEGIEKIADKLAKGDVGIRVSVELGKDYLFIVPPFNNEQIDLRNYNLISKGEQLIYLHKKV